MIEGKQCLGITQRYYNDNYTYYLESRLNEPMQQVTTDQIFLEMDQSKGVYSPFVPVDQSPNINNHETPDTDTFVLGMTIAEHLELSDSVTAQQTKNGLFTIVQIQPGERWVDTMMYGLDNNALYEDEVGYIDIFDDSRNIDGSLIITITAQGDGVLNIGGNKLTMESTEKTYEVTVPFSSSVTIKAEKGTVEILRYTTQKQ